MGLQETIGIEIVSVEKGKAVVQLEVTEKSPSTVWLFAWRGFCCFSGTCSKYWCC